jgi:hypothetical protein
MLTACSQEPVSLSTQLANLTQEDRARMANKIIAKQFPSSPEAQLMLAVVESSILDATMVLPDEEPTEVEALRKHRERVEDKRTAIIYLSGDMEGPENCGVDSAWIRSVIKRAGIKIKWRPLWRRSIE